jgi:hypothetical protein
MGKHKDSYTDGHNPSRSHNGSLIPGGKLGYKADERRSLAIENAEARAKRTPKQQLALLDERLGKGVGATRERARLQAEIDNK